MGDCLMFGLDLEAHAMCAVTAEEERVQFFIGTSSIKSPNQICQLTADADTSRITSAYYPHADEVLALAASPTSADVLASCSAKHSSITPEVSLNLWRTKEEKRHLDELASVKLSKVTRSLEWEPQNNRAAVLFDDSFEIYDIGESSVKLFSTRSFAAGSSMLNAQSWSPHSEGVMLGLATGRDIMSVDTRTESEGMRVSSAHLHRAMHLDFNPNLQHLVVSGGADGAVRIWDWRKPNEALLSLGVHTHWVYQVRYHPVHDQLLLTGGADACVVLSCAQSVSSESAANGGGGTVAEPEEGDTVDEESPVAEKMEDGQLERIEEHEDSVYKCLWAAGDPWTFASLSLDGRIVFSRVSRKHKYALMQL